MENQLQIINQQEVLGKEFRMYGTKENPLFLAKDVANWIEYSVGNVSKLVNMVDEEEKVRNIITTLGGNQEAWFLTEDGLYEVLMQSRKPIAKQFKKEVKKILKQIRQTGGYIPVTEEMSDDEFLAKALIVAQKTLEKKELLLKQQKKQLKEKDDIIAIQKPKVEAYTQFIDAEGLINMDNAARIMNMGRNTLYKNLRDINILRNDTYYSNGRMKAGENHNLPYQSFMKYFKVKVLTKNGKAYKKLYVLPVGMDFIRKKLA